MAFYLLFLFPKNLEAHTTMALAHHPSPLLHISDFWCLYPAEFPWSEHHSTFFSVILPNIIPFSPLFFPDSLPFWGIFSLTPIRIHPLSLTKDLFSDTMLDPSAEYLESQKSQIRSMHVMVICRFKCHLQYTLREMHSIETLSGFSRSESPSWGILHTLKFCYRLPGESIEQWVATIKFGFHESMYVWFGMPQNYELFYYLKFFLIYSITTKGCKLAYHIFGLIY